MVIFLKNKICIDKNEILFRVTILKQKQQQNQQKSSYSQKIELERRETSGVEVPEFRDG